MPAIYLAALLTTAVAAAGFGTLVHRLPLAAHERFLWLAAAVVLPMQPLVFYALRLPLDRWLAAQLDPGVAHRWLTTLDSGAAYRWLTTFYAPLTEEPAKLLPLLIPAIARDVRRENAARYALAIGLGFAIGEMWFIAARVARMPAFSAMPFYQYGGYVGERLMTCVFHAAFVALPLWCGRRRLVLGLAGAMALHWLGNFPLSLMAWNAGGLGREFWMIFVQCFLGLYFLAAVALLSFFAFHRITPARIFYGRRLCPGCGARYDAPVLAINMGRSRYERCPQCRRWHWTQPAP